MFCIMICRESLRLFLKLMSEAFPHSVSTDKNKKGRSLNALIVFFFSSFPFSSALSLCVHPVCVLRAFMFTCSFFAAHKL